LVVIGPAVSVDALARHDHVQDVSAEPAEHKSETTSESGATLVILEPATDLDSRKLHRIEQASNEAFGLGAGVFASGVGVMYLMRRRAQT